ncbi:protein pinocchio isoform X3 [Onthophagus taurus]|uniref:protein pinocchio isoform X3 n=1 Tax=Onthophagus taurus TaxID=166361 RepID=UPI0039BDA60E
MLKTTSAKLNRCNRFSNIFHVFSLQVSSKMSLASVHPAELHSSHSSLTTLSHSLDDITAGLSWSPQVNSEHVLTIEELRNQLTSCFTCGVSWADHHVSLDCSECGGYALERPCPICEGICGAQWKRDLSESHACSKARWQGECEQARSQTTKDQANTLVAQELCSRLEKLSANS